MARKKRRTLAAGYAGAEPAPKPRVDQAAAGQAGDLQGLPDVAGADSQSVRELAEEGQAFEAGIVSGIEEAPAAGSKRSKRVRTREVPEDDVPPEYTDHAPDEPQE